MANRANGFRDEVLGSSVNDATRHQLLTVNRAGAWFGREPLAMRSRPLKGEVILAEVRRFARTIMRAVLARHRRPRFHRLNPWIDQRQAAVIRKAPGEHGAALSGLWATIRGMAPAGGRTGTARAGQPAIRVPPRSYRFFEARTAVGGTLAKTVQLIERPASAHTARSGRAKHRLADGWPGELVLGLVSDMEASFAASRAGYRPLREELALDFGFAAMFATPDGDLLGRSWFAQLRRHDARIDRLARKLQRQGIRPSRSRRYRARVVAFRGFLRAGIRRVLTG